MRNKIIFLCVAAVLCAVSAFADTVTLKSGQEIEGNIIERTDASVKMESYGVESTYTIDEINKINGEEIASAAQESTDSLVSTEEASGVAIEPDEEESLSVSEQAKDSDVLTVTPSPRHGIKEKVTTVTLLALLIIAILFYAYSALCLQFIAKKTGQGPVWMAWVPIANLFLMCKIGSLSYLWLLGIFLGLLPLVGILFSLALCGYLWYRIALARNKPGWLGILACLPIVNLVIIGYLAFSD
ncbi:MAG: hypothetical protein ABIG31_04655 [Candidatus Omnitrophota bacterium]